MSYMYVYSIYLYIIYITTYLGCHPVGGAALARHGGADEGLEARQAEVADLDAVQLVEEDVGRLEVPVEDRGVARVQVVHAARRLEGHLLGEESGEK